jgi:hypothetical protein
MSPGQIYGGVGVRGYAGDPEVVKKFLRRSVITGNTLLYCESSTIASYEENGRPNGFPSENY